MAPVTVRYNGPLTTEEAVEHPDPSMTVGEYVAAFVDAHNIGGADFGLQGSEVDEHGFDRHDLHGNPVVFEYESTAKVTDLSGRTVTLVVGDPSPTAGVELPASAKSVDQVLAWVDDADVNVEDRIRRARVAYDAEIDSTKPRSSLLEILAAALAGSELDPTKE